MERASEYAPTRREVEVGLQWFALHAELSRRDPNKFFEFVLREEHTRERIRITPHQELILAFVMAHPMCVIRAPIGFSKTYLLAALTMWFMGTDPMERGAIVSASRDISEKVVLMVRSYIEASRELAMVFPDLHRSQREGEPWTQTKLTIARPEGARDASLVASGVGSRIQGSRISWVLADDLLDPENTANEKALASTLSWFRSAILTRLDAKGARIVVCNVPWVSKTSPESVGDITYELESEPHSWPTLTLDAYGDVDIRNTDWDSDLIRPANDPNEDGVRHRLTAHDAPEYAIHVGEDPVPGWIDSKDQVPLWPEKFSFEVLAEMRKTLGPIDFMRAVRCKPRTAITSAERTKWIGLCKQAAVVAERHRLSDALGPGPTRITAVDPAMSKNKKSNCTSILTFEVLGDGRRVVLENQVGRWQSPESADRIISAVQRYGSIAVVEGNQAQRWLRDIVKLKNRTIPVQVAITGSNKNDQRFGVQSIFIELEQVLWLLPNDGRMEGSVFVQGKSPDGIQNLISDLLEYDPSEHTGDSLMALWIGREFARRKGLLDPAFFERNEDVSEFAAIGAR